MESQFNTLISSYRDNLIEYKLTGNPTNKTAYTSAKEGIDNIIMTLQGNVNNNQSEISGYYNEDTKKRLSDLHEESKNSKLGLSSVKDQLEAAKMRSNVTVVTPDISNNVMIVGLMALGALVLSIF
jgi:outer membrane receptor for ferrienterochelin and colicin